MSYYVFFMSPASLLKIIESKYIFTQSFLKKYYSFLIHLRMKSMIKDDSYMFVLFPSMVSLLHIIVCKNKPHSINYKEYTKYFATVNYLLCPSTFSEDSNPITFPQKLHKLVLLCIHLQTSCLGLL